MKVLLAIDHLGPGGAQRQLVALAEGLRRAGDEVDLFTYHSGHGFFGVDLEQLGVRLHVAEKRSRYSIRPIWELVKLLRAGNYDVALAYLATPSIYLELASIFSPGTVIVASERSSHHAEKRSWLFKVRRQLHRFADCVVANSEAQGSWLRTSHRWLESKTVVIHNGTPPHAVKTVGASAPDRRINLLAIGRVSAAKNVHGLLRGLLEFEARRGWIPCTTWVGPLTGATRVDAAYKARIDSLLGCSAKLSAAVRFVGKKENIAELLSNHDGLVHPSFFEGFPNVVCEALAAGRPVLAANIADNRYLVGGGERGRLFDPNSPVELCDAITWLADLPKSERYEISLRCIEFASTELSVEKLVQNYRELFQNLMSRRH